VLRTRTKRSEVALLALAAFLLAVILSPAANAHVKSFNATLTLQYKANTETFFGTLGTNRRCKGGRLVSLFDADTNAVVGTDTTGPNGRYSIEFEADGGFYYAQVLPVIRGGYGHVHTCEGDISRTIDTRKGGGSSNSPPATNRSSSALADQGQGGRIAMLRLLLALLLGR
jgi:hypothetical protein